VPKQLEFHGLSPEQLTIANTAILKLVHEYTREAGVRNLEREIASLCRKVARKVASSDEPTTTNGKHQEQIGGDASPIDNAQADQADQNGGEETETRPMTFTVEENDVASYLGPEQFVYGLAEETDEIGVAMGVAWTPTGGDVLSIEVVPVRGKGALQLTGHLGEVMKESAQAAMSYVRAHAEQFGIDANYFEEHVFHIHIPEGAVPKDGPSAGITLTTALISALTQKPVRHDVAMTGEVTLRGKVLGIGGLKEKTLAAHRAGIKTFILPRKNEKDIVDLPEKIKTELNLVPVSSMDEVLSVALNGR
jgi:ATP-dependent Lon protease